MIIISHRGYWKKISEKNKKIAFERSFKLGFGTETDFRDYKRKLVISHDVPKGTEVSADNFFKIFFKLGDKKMPLALNIKADGIFDLLNDYLKKYKITNYFAFDMSVPDQIQYAKRKIKFFTRQSEYEQIPSLYDKADGVWLDEFKGHWISKNIIRRHLSNGKKVAIVSPELHGRNYLNEWGDYKSLSGKCDTSNLILCTDLPEEAARFFGL